MPELEDSAAGIEAARKAIVALAEGDDRAALHALNATSHAEAVHAAAYLLACLRESVSNQVRHDPRRLELALKAGASAAAEDAVITQVGLITQEAERDL